MLSKVKLYLIFILVFSNIFILSTTVWADDSRLDFSYTFTKDSPMVLIWGIAYKNIGLEFGEGSFIDPYSDLIHREAQDNQSYVFVKELPVYFEHGVNIQVFFDLSDQSKIYFGIGRYDFCYRDIVCDTEGILYYSNQFKYNTEYAYCFGTRLYLSKGFGLNFGYHTIFGFNGSLVFSLN